ncbi:MAG TPA: DUF2917 domain-containing protein [Burkholderiales bacterium]|jgi:hypothetical protein|nr:DUF2917 domain-containing protein [Burkholderiales bacterium]
MGAREFEIAKGAMLKIDPLAGDCLRVRWGEVWVTQFEDTRDYTLRTGDSIVLDGKGAMLAVAYKPTLLDLFRADPAGFRERIEVEAKRSQARSLWALVRNIFGAA